MLFILGSPKTTLHFCTPLGSLGAHTVHLRLIGKPIVDILLVITELFSLGATAEVQQANIDWKSPFLKGVGQFGPKFQVEVKLS